MANDDLDFTDYKPNPNIPFLADAPASQGANPGTPAVVDYSRPNGVQPAAYGVQAPITGASAGAPRAFNQTNTKGLSDLLQSRIDRVGQIDQQGPLARFFGGNNERAMLLRQIPQISQVLNQARSEDTTRLQLEQNYYRIFADVAKGAAELTP